MNTQLNQKEAQLIKELKGQESLCIEKYSKGAQCAVDGQLKGLFSRIAQIEQEHLNTLAQIENGNASRRRRAEVRRSQPLRKPTA